MSPPGAGLLDTSVFVGREGGRPLGELPSRIAISVVTIGELRLGVLNAGDDDTRARRAASIHRAVKLTDALIAATAVEHGLPVVTQDGDYAEIAGAHPALKVLNV